MALTELLMQFQGIFATGVSKLTPYALSTFAALVALDFIWSMIGKLTESDNGFHQLIGTVFIKLIKYGFWSYAITNYGALLNAITDSFITLGLTAGGNQITLGQFTNPSALVTQGLHVVSPLKMISKNFSAWSVVGGTSAISILLILICYLVIVFAFFVIAWQIFITLAEYYCIGALLIIFLPFGVFSKTAFLTEKAIGAIVSFSVRLAVLAMIVSVAHPIIWNTTIPENVETTDLFNVISGVGAVALLAWQAPSLAGSLMSGSPSLSGSGMIAGAAGVAMTAGSMVGKATGIGAAAGAAGAVGKAMSGNNPDQNAAAASQGDIKA